MPILENVEKTYENYMGTIITLSNHSPFNDLEKYDEFDYCYECRIYGDNYYVDEDGNLESFCSQCSMNPYRVED